MIPRGWASPEANSRVALKRALLSLATLAFCCGAGCKSAQPTQQTGSAIPTPAPSKTIQPIELVPPASTGDASEILSALRKAAGDSFKGYTIGRKRTQIQLQDVSVAVLNQMDFFGEPFVTGIRTRTLLPAERERVTETITKSTKNHLGDKLHVIDVAQYTVVVAFTGENGAIFDHNQNAFGVIDLRVLLADSQTKSVLWYDTKAMGLGRDLDSAVGGACSSINDNLDVLFRTKQGK